MSWLEVQRVYRVHSCSHKSGRIRFTGFHMGHRFRWLPSAVTKPRERAWKKRGKKRDRRTLEEKVNQRFESFTLEVDFILKNEQCVSVCVWLMECEGGEWVFLRTKGDRRQRWFPPFILTCSLYWLHPFHILTPLWPNSLFILSLTPPPK